RPFSTGSIFGPKGVKSGRERFTEKKRGGQGGQGRGEVMATSSKDDSELGTSDGFRRTWDTTTFEKMAKDRIKAEKEGDKKGSSVPVQRELLKRREYKVDLDSKLGKTLIITRDTPQSQTGGYYCNVCDCVVKDSINFLDHINGRKPLRSRKCISHSSLRDHISLQLQKVISRKAVVQSWL
ncbi:Zinc finger matrin-type protein 2, partial [Geodia barretti]